jgi:predicted acetyltransferase
MHLVLRPFEPQDETAAVAAHQTFASEGFTFLLGYSVDMPWLDWLADTERTQIGSNLPPGRARAVFLAAVVDGELVGRVSVRFVLNELLAREGGHIGYGVLPAFRCEGYATEILRQAIELAHEEGVDPILVVCNEDNVGSATVIERCGGVFEGRATSEDGTAIRRFWI